MHRRLLTCTTLATIACLWTGSAEAAWLHDLDPFAVQIPGFPGGGIRWYGLSYLAGFAIAWWLIRRVLTVGANPTLDPKRAADLVFCIAIGVLIGGRLGYVLFYRPDLIIAFDHRPPFWGVLAMNQGGMASHGGMIGGVVAAAWFAWRHGQPFLFLGDLFAFGAPLGLFLGRMANFVNGELYGRPCAADFPLAVRFPQELYEMPQDRLAQLATTAPVELLGKDPTHHAFATRMVEGIQQGWPAARAYLEPLLTPRHPSQLYAGILEGLVVFAVLAALYHRPRKAGIIGAAFCMTYAVMRIINELFRMPDAHLRDAEFAAWGITRGQWLSVLLFAIGTVILLIARNRQAAPMGGWRRPRHPAPDTRHPVPGA